MSDDKKAIDKWSEVHEKAQAIQHFLTWLKSQGYRIVEEKTYTRRVGCVDLPDPNNPDHWEEYEDTDWYTKDASDLDLVYQFYEIDPDELEQGRRDILESFRTLHNQED